jgi:hypothetical protein
MSPSCAPFAYRLALRMSSCYSASALAPVHRRRRRTPLSGAHTRAPLSIPTAASLRPSQLHATWRIVPLTLWMRRSRGRNAPNVGGYRRRLRARHGAAAGARGRGRTYVHAARGEGRVRRRRGRAWRRRVVVVGRHWRGRVRDCGSETRWAAESLQARHIAGSSASLNASRHTRRHNTHCSAFLYGVPPSTVKHSHRRIFQRHLMHNFKKKGTRMTCRLRESRKRMQCAGDTQIVQKCNRRGRTARQQSGHYQSPPPPSVWLWSVIIRHEGGVSVGVRNK